MIIIIVIIVQDAKNSGSWSPGRLNFIRWCIIISVYLVQLSRYTQKQQTTVSGTDQYKKVV
jgi:hypothetical protein